MSLPGKSSGNGNYEFDYMRKPVILPRSVALRNAFYNPSKGTVFGKTGKQWGITGAFYFVFFTVLAMFCAICYQGLIATIDERVPRWQLQSSLIGSNPGLGFRPMPKDIAKGPVISYNARNTTDVDLWVENINDYMKNYVRTNETKHNPNEVICHYGMASRDPEKFCAVDITEWGPCSPSQNYSFDVSAPCIFIKLNRIYGWEPEFYENADELPDEAPQALKDHIRKVDAKRLKTIWMSCNGTKKADQELIGEIEYFPKEAQGFAGYYYPYTNVKGYLSPLVGVHFKRPKCGHLINVECRAWAKNIKYDRGDRLGMVRFELRIDPPDNQH